MAVNNLRRTLNLVKDLNANGDVVDASLSDSPDTLPSLTFPSITSVHPTANLSSGDLVFIVGSNFGQHANVTLISNTGVETVAGNVTFNSTSNVTFTWPLGAGSVNLNPYDMRLKIKSTGLSNALFNSANGFAVSHFQGSVSGYTSGGHNGSSRDNTIDKFPFSSDGNASDVGDLTVARNGSAGQSSSVSGYTSGGVAPTISPIWVNIIDKFPFAADGNASDVGDLTAGRGYLAGQSSTVSGYSSGGRDDALTPISLNVIDKFSFSSDGNASDVGDLTVNRHSVAGQSSTASGYTSGGIAPDSTPTRVNIIDKFPFASDGNATDVGDLTAARNSAADQSSLASGYTSGGYDGSSPGRVNIIDKFPFSSDSNASDVGDLTVNRSDVAGQSSTASGYSSGGYGTSQVNTIDKFPFASDGNASDVGDLTVARYGTAGQQV